MAIQIFNQELTRHGEKKIDLSQQPMATFSDIHSLVTKEQQEWDAKKWKIGNIALRDKVHGLLTQISTYAIVGDIILQHHAEFSAIAWGTFRFLLQASLPRTNLLVQ